ncbi:hypothetical protein F503_07255 [Ophiostoma piceae UAMH 11346]|uniref:Uncharacterized protein n=1 Tax=Ophiostoma piceae (strain UAMH 11346) TaxID=1262450 RepID=S3C7G2_OPHP1|nr:hypothetical protein F503_07255 [Ophiostoma piceae UAMH 11346]
MPDLGRRRLGLAGPPPQPPEQDSTQNLKQGQKQRLQKQAPQTRWKELQAAFQRPQEFLQASQPRQERDAAHLCRRDVNEVLDDSPTEHSAGLRPSPVLIPIATTSIQPAAMGSTATDGGERHNFGQRTLLPAPVQSVCPPSDHVKAASTESTTDPDATPKASVPSRPNRARGMFKVSSFLNLRSSNFGQIGNSGQSNGSAGSTKSRKGNESDTHTTTPLESPMEAPPASPWLEFGRRTGSRAGSRNSSNDKDRESKSEYFDLATPVTIPNLPVSVSNMSSADTSKECTDSIIIPTPALATISHNWKQWDQDHNDRASFLVNAADFTWHRPSFRQIIESLQVAVVSGETVSCSYPGSHSAFEPTRKKPSASQLVLSGAPMSSRSKRRPSMQTPPSPVTAGPENPIPGRYRSHIMCAIEGIRDMQAALDIANRRATEAEESRVRDLVQFAGLSEEWAERERQYEVEIRQLKDAMAAAVSSPQPARHRRMFSSLRSEDRPGQIEPNNPNTAVLYKNGKELDKRPASDSDTCAHDTFLNRVRAAIEASSRTAETKPMEEETILIVDKREAKPALICDLDHDKIMSDRLFWELSVAERNKCRQRRRYAARNQPMEQPTDVPESTTICGAAKTKKARKGKKDVRSDSTKVSSEECRDPKAEKGGSLDREPERKGRPKSVKQDASSSNTEDTADDKPFNTSPRQSAPSRPLGFPQPDTKLVRWSTSQPFSPPASEDDNSGDDDEGCDEGDYNSSSEVSRPVFEKPSSDPRHPASHRGGRRQSTVSEVDTEHVSDCTAIYTARGVSS